MEKFDVKDNTQTFSPHVDTEHLATRCACD